MGFTKKLVALFKSTFWLSFAKPWKLILRNKMSFFIWFIFTIFAGQIGFILNIIIRVINGKLTLSQCIYLESASGSFYTFSIALIASILGPLFVNFLESSPTDFRSIKIFLITILIFTLFFGGVFYSTSIDNNFDNLHLEDLKFSIDWWQGLFFCVSVTLALYSFNVFKLDEHKKDFENINDNYAIKEDRKRDLLDNKSSSLITDAKGNRI